MKTRNVIYDDDDFFNVPSASRLAPRLPASTAQNSFSLFNVHKRYKFPHKPVPAHHHFVSALLSFPSQPFVISFLRLSPRLPPTEGWSTVRPISRTNVFLREHRELLLQSSISWTSDDESALAFHGSAFDPRGEALSPPHLSSSSVTDPKPRPTRPAP